MANINKKDRDGQTALMHASKNGYLDIVQLLLANEADVNTENNNGKTALFYATWKKHNNVAKALLDNGADAVHIYRNFTPHVIEADGWGAGGLVFINKGSVIYHNSRCSALRTSEKPLGLSQPEATARDFLPCNNCNP